MKTENQRIAIAIACGARFWASHAFPNHTWLGWNPSFHAHEVDPRKVDSVLDDVPEYLSDLNAMHSAEESLLRKGDAWGAYCDLLMDLLVKNGGYQSAELLIHASAELRAEAFLKSQGLWV